MDVAKTTVGTVVDVGSGVKVLRGVDVRVGVGGMATKVCVAAAADVNAMDVLIAFGSRGGMGVAIVGTHAITSASVISQLNIFVLRDNEFLRMTKAIATDSRIDDLFHTSHLPILQADFDSVRMVRGLGEYILHNATGQFACALILF